MVMLEKIKEITPEEKEQWVLIFPKDSIYVEKYNKEIDFNDELFKKVIDNFNNPNISKPFIDIEHDFGKSCGDIVELKVGENGLYGFIKWNDYGYEMIKDRNYRYLSPSWGNLKDNKKNKIEDVLISVSLTNIPAIMKQEQIQSQRKVLEIIGENMNLNDLVKTLSITPESSDEEILTEVKRMLDEAKVNDEILIKTKEMLTEVSSKFDELVKVNEELSKEVEGLKEEKELSRVEGLKKEAVEYISLSIKERDIPTSEDVVNELVSDYILNSEKTKKYLSLFPVRKVEDVNKLSNSSIVENNLSEEDRKIMLSAGYDVSKPEDVEHYLKYGKV